jgi:hypothetical protein
MAPMLNRKLYRLLLKSHRLMMNFMLGCLLIAILSLVRNRSIYQIIMLPALSIAKGVKGHLIDLGCYGTWFRALRLMSLV